MRLISGRGEAEAIASLEHKDLIFQCLFQRTSFYVTGFFAFALPEGFTAATIGLQTSHDKQQLAAEPWRQQLFLCSDTGKRHGVTVISPYDVLAFSIPGSLYEGGRSSERSGCESVWRVEPVMAYPSCVDCDLA